MTVPFAAVPYPIDALEHVSERAPEFHHGKRHKAQVDKLNAAIEYLEHGSHETTVMGIVMDISKDHGEDRPLVPKEDGNPDGKGANGFLEDWRATEPRGVVAKPQRQLLAEFFTSMLVLSASIRYRPAPGCSNYLYWIDGQWSLSLIAPDEWSEERRAGFAATCVLQRDMTWTIVPSVRLDEDNPATDAIRRFYEAFTEMLDTDLTFEEILPSYVSSLHYYQRLYASALRRSVSAAVTRGGQASGSCRQWRTQLPRLNTMLLAYRD